ncbi:MAG: hypothetical protein ABIO05_03115 [Ferruginibacter sp.]
MKTSITLLAIILAFTITACKAPFYNTANNMRLINGTVYTNDGREIPGQITLNLENYRPSRLEITVLPKDAKQPEKIAITNVKGINIRNDYYEPKLIDMGGFGNTDEFRFVKRMTKEGSRIHMYELYEQVTRQSNSGRYNTGAGSYTSSENSYYIVTPAHTRQQAAWSLDGRRLTPNFEDKMSEIVKDCPALAAKIKQKEKGYFYAQISLIDSKRIETMLTIIDEYNKCGK